MARPKKSDSSPLAVIPADQQLEFQIQSLPIASLVTDDIYQPRHGLNNDVVVRYAEILADEILLNGKSECPPVDVFCFIEGGAEIYYLVHGHHRYAAFKKCQAGEIPCKVYRGSKDDAIRLAMQANIFNGLQLSRKEVAIACRRYIAVNDALPENQRESDRAIARRFLVDPKSIRNYRAILDAEIKASRWQPNQLLLYSGWNHADSSLIPFYLCSFNGADEMSDGTYQASVVFEWPLLFSTNWYPVQKLEEVPDDLCIVPQPELKSGSIAYSRTYGYGLVLHLVQADQDFDDPEDPAFRCIFMAWNYGLEQLWADQLVALTTDQAKWLCGEIALAYDAPLLDITIARLQNLITSYQNQAESGIDPLLCQSQILKLRKDLEYFDVNSADSSADSSGAAAASAENEAQKALKAEIDSLKVSPWWENLKDFSVDDLRDLQKYCSRLINYKQSV